MSNTRDRIIELLQQPSTWRGIINFLTAIGTATTWYTISPDFAAGLLSAGLGVSGAIGFLFSDAPSVPATEK